MGKSAGRVVALIAIVLILGGVVAALGGPQKIISELTKPKE
ncbi:MAG: hypothetical protein V4480_00865 [Patescibacteria group bacterium]